MPVRKLFEFLDGEKVKYVSISHSPAYTAQEVAAAAHVPGKELAKTVIVKVDGDMAMVVLPASYKIDFDLLREAIGVGSVELASEAEFMDLFPDCEVGAMPPFGHFYGLKVYAAQSLAEDEEIAFNACTHSELVRLRFADFARLAKPQMLTISQKV